MTLQTFTLDGTPGATVSGTNITLTGSGLAAFSDTDKVIGSTAAIFQAADAAVRSARCACTPDKVQGIDVFLKTPDRIPTAGSPFTIMTARHSNTSGTVFTIEYQSAQGLSVFEVAGATRTNIPATGVIPINTWVRLHILVSIGVSTNDSNLVAKLYSSTSPFTTQIGTTLTRTGVNLGTNQITMIDGGVLTASTPGLKGGMDNLRIDDGRTTDFTAPPAASAPTCVLVVDNQDPEEDATVTFAYTGSTAGTGTINGWELTCIEAPAGSPLPAITDPLTATPSSVPTTGGQWKYSGRVRNSSGIWSDPVVLIVYAHAKNNVDVKVRRVIDPGGWTVAGTGAASLLDALRNPSPTGAYWVESPTNPATTDLLVVEMDPFGPNAISVFASLFWADGALDGHVGVYMPNASTLLEQLDIDLTSSNVQYENVLQPADLVTATTAARRNLVVKVAGGPA